VPTVAQRLQRVIEQSKTVTVQI